MNVIHYESTEKTPMIRGDIEKGEILVRGRSYPESTVDFYKNFKTWLEDFYQKAPHDVIVTLDLEYFNTSTTAVIYDMLQRLSQLRDTNNIKIIWLYDEDDIDMTDKGHDLKRLLGEILEMKVRESEF